MDVLVTTQFVYAPPLTVTTSSGGGVNKRPYTYRNRLRNTRPPKRGFGSSGSSSAANLIQSNIVISGPGTVQTS